MPTSIYSYIPIFVQFLRETRPMSLLDVGVGNGKLGFIAREMLDVILCQRYLRRDWTIRIDGIEIFADYIQEHQQAIYDEIYIGDALDIIPRLNSYDMIILGDVLEHFEKERAWELFDRCIEHSQGHVILNIPLGDNWHQGEMYGNKHEAHRSAWRWEEFEAFVWKYKIFKNEDTSYGTFLIRKDDYIDFRIQQHCQEAAVPVPNPHGNL